MKTLRHIPFIAAISLMLMAGCERRPLEEPENYAHVSVEIDTKDIRNITSDIYNSSIETPSLVPEVMHILFYEEDADRLVTEAFISNRSTNEAGNTVISGNIQIHPGDYRMAVYNFGTESTIIGNYNDWTDSYLYASPVSESIASKYKSKLPEDEVITYTPDHLHLAVHPELSIPYHIGVHSIETTARTTVETYYLQIRVDGLEYVSSAQAFLTGMAASYDISDDRTVTEEQNTIYFTLQKGDDKGTPVICTIFNTFGHVDGTSNKLEVTFDLRTLDGKTVQHTFDITDVFKTPDAVNHNWLLLEETITVDPPPTPPSSGGMDPWVSDWENEDHEIMM